MENKKVWVAGHNGMVGSAIVRRLASEPCDILTIDRAELDLADRQAVDRWLADVRPDAVFLAAAKVGGIYVNNTYPADFLHDNLTIQLNVIEAARRAGVDKLVFLGSSCIYPRDAAQPMHEDDMLTGPLEPTNEWYAIAKIAGLKLCQAYRRQHACDFISVMPTNLYGPGDNFHPEHSHVPAALMQRMHTAKSNGDRTVTVWGSGRPLREFMHVDDLANACIFLLKNYSEDKHINIGTGDELSISEFAELMARVTGYSGSLDFDSSHSDGVPRKLLDSSRLTALGWHPSISLKDGLQSYYTWFLDHQAELRAV